MSTGEADTWTARLFLALIGAQAAHSVEEYYFALYDVLPPARWVSGFFSDEPRVGFAIANVLLVLFGVWTYAARVRPAAPGARGWAWFWTILEGLNGSGHLLFALTAGGYFPGAATAPILIALALGLATALNRTRAENADAIR
jgi:hypothetical protein